MLDYIEELFKNEELAKSKNLINALLYHADIYRDPKASPAAKAKAMEQIKLIGSGKSPIKQSINKQTKVKTRPEHGARVVMDAPAATGPAGDRSSMPKTSAPVTSAPVTSAMSTSTPVAGQKVNLKYHPLYQHYNITPEVWDKLSPQHRAGTFEFHNEVVAGKHPEFAHVQKMVQGRVKKSLENVLGSLKKIKENLDKSGYGPKKAGLYNPADNIKRKQSRTGDIAGVGPNVAVRSFSTKPGQLSAKQSAVREEKKKKKLSGPVKVFTPEEIKALEAKQKLSKP